MQVLEKLDMIEKKSIKGNNIIVNYDEKPKKMEN